MSIPPTSQSFSIQGKNFKFAIGHALMLQLYNPSQPVRIVFNPLPAIRHYRELRTILDNNKIKHNLPHDN